jgi:hypothetical protein
MLWILPPMDQWIGLVDPITQWFSQWLWHGNIKDGTLRHNVVLHHRTFCHMGHQIGMAWNVLSQAIPTFGTYPSGLFYHIYFLHWDILKLNPSWIFICIAASLLSSLWPPHSKEKFPWFLTAKVMFVLVWVSTPNIIWFWSLTFLYLYIFLIFFIPKWVLFLSHTHSWLLTCMKRPFKNINQPKPLSSKYYSKFFKQCIIVAMAHK